MKTVMIKPLLATTALLTLLGACGDGQRGVFFGEAGSFLNEGYFGSATVHNTGVQNGDIQHVIGMANRFAQEVPDTVNFAFNSAQLDQQALAIIARQADWIKQFPEVRFRVFGYTDKVGSEAYNKRLGMRRANTVVNALVAHGISRSRLEAVVSYGETKPLIDVPGRERANRRALTEVSGFVGRHPTVMNGKYAEIIFREYVQSAYSEPALTRAGLDGSATQ